MRTKDIKPGEAYATCDGQYVVPLGIETNWYRTTEKQEGTGKNIEVLKQWAEGDPWNSCNNSRRRPDLGLLCNWFEVDADGKPVGKGRKTIVATRDVKGTWLDYLVLYAHKVRERAEQRMARELRDRLEKDTGSALAKAIGASVSVHYYAEDSLVNRSRTRDEWGISFHALTTEQKDLLVNTLVRSAASRQRKAKVKA